jgi:hypothetical protein
MNQTRMKTLAVGAVLALALGTALAQESTTTTTTTNPVTGTTTTESSTTTSSGTITAYTPGSDYITFRTTNEPAPVRYYYTKSTTILDPEGRTLTWSAIRPDMPATVYYVKEGDRVVIRKIMLSEPSTVYEKKETTTTTTTNGTVATFEPGKTIVIRTEAARDPISYVLGKTVHYLNKAGKEVEEHTIKRGTRVHVYYDDSGETRVVNRVVVDED